MQKIKFVGSLALVIVSLQLLSAQKSSRQDYLVLNSLDTVFGTIEPINDNFMLNLSRKIRIRNLNGKRKKYRTREVLALQVSGIVFRNFRLRQSSRGMQFLQPYYDIDPLRGEIYFLRLRSEGKLSHYLMEWSEQGSSLVQSADLIIREGDDFFIRATQGLFGLKRKALNQYFFNCPDMREKLLDDNLKTVEQLVIFYNENCG